jgi:UDP-glucose 4-epimerase
MVDAGTTGPVVVTGGAGAIGSVLVRALLREERTVRVIDNLSGGRWEHLAEIAHDPRLEFHRADLNEPAAYADRIRGATEIWHLAANADIQKGTADPAIDLREGLLNAIRVLDAARRYDVPRVLFSSSSVVYGLPSVYPTPEDYGPLLPQSIYGGSKLAVEGFLSSYAHSYGLRAYIFRFANIIGPFMTHGVIYDFFEKLRRDPTRLEVLGDGKQAKSYLRSEDCVAGMLYVRDHAQETVNVYNLGARDRISVREIAERVVAAHGGRARIVYTGGERGWVGDVPQQLLDISKVQHLGWSPALTSSEAVDRTISELARARAILR